MSEYDRQREEWQGTLMDGMKRFVLVLLVALACMQVAAWTPIGFWPLLPWLAYNLTRYISDQIEYRKHRKDVEQITAASAEF